MRALSVWVLSPPAGAGAGGGSVAPSPPSRGKPCGTANEGSTVESSLALRTESRAMGNSLRRAQNQAQSVGGKKKPKPFEGLLNPWEDQAAARGCGSAWGTVLACVQNQTLARL